MNDQCLKSPPARNWCKAVKVQTAMMMKNWWSSQCKSVNLLAWWYCGACIFLSFWEVGFSDWLHLRENLSGERRAKFCTWKRCDRKELKRNLRFPAELLALLSSDCVRYYNIHCGWRNDTLCKCQYSCLVNPPTDESKDLCKVLRTVPLQSSWWAMNVNGLSHFICKYVCKKKRKVEK